MRALSLLVVLLLCANPHIARAEPAPAPTLDEKVEARRYFEAGVAFQKADDFQAASDAYATSLQLYPTKSALFNLANCQRALHQYAEAWHSLELLQQRFGTELTEPMRTTSRAQLEELANLTGVVTVETEPPGAQLTLDDKPIGTAPLGSAVRVAIGQHSVTASLEGYVTQESAFRLSPKQALTVSLSLVPAPPAQTTPTQVTETTLENPTPKPIRRDDLQTSSTKPNAPEQPSKAWAVAGWVGVATGALSVAAGARAGVLALDVDEHLASVCVGGHCSEKYTGDVRRLDRLTLSANVFVGAGAALIATGTALLLLPMFQQESGPVSVSAGPMSLRVEGSF